jgi:hypothetical protein
MRELFKFKVTAMVLITTWAGFYLGSMHSGISSVQRGLIETLVGVALVSAGASALNEALERKTDAKMIRTANRPIAAGRISLWQGLLMGFGAVAAGGFLATFNDKSSYRRTCSPYSLHLRGRLYPVEEGDHAGDISRSFPRVLLVHCWVGQRLAVRLSGRELRFSPSFSSGNFRISWPSPGSIARTMAALESKCSLSYSLTVSQP